MIKTSKINLNNRQTNIYSIKREQKQSRLTVLRNCSKGLWFIRKDKSFRKYWKLICKRGALHPYINPIRILRALRRIRNKRGLWMIKIKFKVKSKWFKVKVKVKEVLYNPWVLLCRWEFLLTKAQILNLRSLFLQGERLNKKSM